MKENSVQQEPMIKYELFDTEEEITLPVSLLINHLDNFINGEPPKKVLEQVRENLLIAKKEYMKTHTETHKGLESFYRKLNRKIKTRENMGGTTPVPSVILRNGFYTKELIEKWVQEGVIQSVKSKGADMDIDLVLSLEPVNKIMDTFGIYAEQAFNNEILQDTENQDDPPMGIMRLSENGESYKLRVKSFSDFCKTGGIKGNLRKEVKKVLFPSNNKERGLLEYISLVAPDENNPKIKNILDIRFVSAVYVGRTVRETPLKKSQDTKETQQRIDIGAFDLEINAEVYNFLNKKNQILKGGKIESLESFQQIPLQLTNKINLAFEWIKSIKQSKTEKSQYLENPDKRERERIYRTIKYCIDKWNTGKIKRKSDMTVTWEELHEKGLVPTHKKRRGKRKRYLATVAVVFDFLIQEHYIFYHEQFYDVQVGLEKPVLIFKKTPHEEKQTK